MATSKKSNDFLVQGTILAFASILVRFIGLLYRIPMANILGEEGNGIYSISFNIYNIVLILSSYSLPLAVSKLIAAKNVTKQYESAFRIFKSALVFAIVVGTIACSFLYFGADFLEKLYEMPGVSKPLRVLAPTIFVVAVLGVFRGLYQGKNTMLPTAISQVLEQIVNAIMSIVCAYGLMKSHSASSEISAYGAAGGTIGTLSGALTALAFVIFIYVLYRPTLIRQVKRDRIGCQESTAEIYKLLILTVTPVILSQAVYQLSGTIDDALFSKVMKWRGMNPEVRSSIIGVYSSQYKVLISLPISISSALSSSLIPSIVRSMEVGELKVVRTKVRESIKFNMVVAFPCMIGLVVLARPIIILLFPNLVTYRTLASNVLAVGSFAIIFYALSTTTSGVLQGINRMRLPVINSAISLVIHVIITFILLAFTDLGIYGLVIGNITFPMVVSILNWRSVARELKYKQEIFRTFVIPLVSSGIMGVVTYFTYYFVYGVLKSNAISIVAAIGLSVIVYFACILVFGCFRKKELYDLPLGRRIVKIGEKMHLL